MTSVPLFFQKHNDAFVSTWPVLTEVCHLLPADVAARFLSWVFLGGLNVAELGRSALELMAGWMRHYGDLSMDLADASLLWVAQEQGLRRMAPSIDATTGSTDSLVERASKTCWIHQHSAARRGRRHWLST